MKFELLTNENHLEILDEKMSRFLGLKSVHVTQSRINELRTMLKEKIGVNFADINNHTNKILIEYYKDGNYRNISVPRILGITVEYKNGEFSRCEK
jgi:hypothetical protein